LKNQDTILGVFLVILSSSGIVASLSLPEQGVSNVSPGFYPMILFILLGLCSLGVLWKGIKSKAEYRFPQFKWGKVIPFTILIIIYSFSLKWVGFVIATIGFFLLAMWTLGERNKWKLVGIPLLSTLVIYVVFVHLFQILLPT